jgi:hypothetical protein
VGGEPRSERTADEAGANDEALAPSEPNL